MTTSVQVRRDPQKGKKEFSSNKGFTLIELMIVIGVIAIITSLALPSYRTLIEKRQVTSGAEQLGAFISSVQSEAVRRNERLYVDYRSSGSNWCVGVTSLTGGTTSCDCTKPDTDGAACKVGGEMRVFNQGNLNYGDILKSDDGDGEFVFDPVRGIIFDTAAMSGYDTAEWELESDKGTYALNVQVTATGRVKTCSKSSGKSVPGFKTCSNDY